MADTPTATLAVGDRTSRAIVTIETGPSTDGSPSTVEATFAVNHGGVDVSLHLSMTPDETAALANAFLDAYTLSRRRSGGADQSVEVSR